MGDRPNLADLGGAGGGVFAILWVAQSAAIPGGGLQLDGARCSSAGGELSVMRQCFCDPLGRAGRTPPPREARNPPLTRRELPFLPGVRPTCSYENAAPVYSERQRN